MRKVILTLLVAVAFMLNAQAQDRTITGKVTDDKGAAISGVSVTSYDKTRGTQTDRNGSYSIVVGPFTKTLTFSSVNFESQTQNIRGNQINIRLTSSTGTLEDVVVTGVKNIKRSEYTGAVSRVRTREVQDKPVGSFDQLLQGAAPGVLALTPSGQPGSSATIIIRGQGSIAGGTNPLYVLDGIPIESSTFQGLNPNDFASLEILKDAAAAAVYGSRGSAGVIVITSKKGTGGKMKLSYNAQMGIKQKPDFASTPMNTAQLLAAQQQYGATINRNNLATNNTPYTGTATIPGWYYSPTNPRYAALTPAAQATANTTLDSISKINNDWRDYMFRRGTFSNHEISVSGGTGKTRIFSSVALYNEEGVTPRTDMQRISFRNNVDYADDKLSVSLASSVAYTKRNFQQTTVTNNLGNPFLAVNVTTPYALVYKPDGSFASGSGASFSGANQLELTALDKNYSDQIKTVLSLNSSYKITRDVTASLVSGIDFRETQTSNYGSKLAFGRVNSTTAQGKAGFQTEGLTRFASVDVRPSLDYRHLFATKHSVNVSVYGEMIKEFGKAIAGTGYGIDPRTPNTPAAITQGDANNLLFSSVTGSKTQNALFSGLITGAYTYNDKYSISGSYRYDGSSKLKKENRWNSFYSIGGVWTIDKEPFMKNVKIFNSLRLRGSYGSAGDANNFPFGDFGYLDTYAANGNYSGLSTIYVSNLATPDLKWETTYQANIGLDFSMLKERIYGSFDIYDRETRDLFVQKQLSAEAGGYIPYINAGRLSNKGVEADLSFEVIRKKDFVWTLNGKVGYNKNRVEDLGGLNSFSAGTALISEGKALGTHNEVRWAGVDAATGAPLYYKKDGSITTTYSADDKVQEFGTYEAPWKGGFSSFIRYKNFDFNVFFTWQQGATKSDNLEYFTENPVGFLGVGYNQSTSLHFWQNPGDVVSTPSPIYGTNFSSKIIHDASFIRLKDVTLGYTFPSEGLRSLKFLSRARFYVQATNIYMWTKWRGMDPEAGPININLSEFPNPRAFTAGLNLTF